MPFLGDAIGFIERGLLPEQRPRPCKTRAVVATSRNPRRKGVPYPPMRAPHKAGASLLLLGWLQSKKSGEAPVQCQ